MHYTNKQIKQTRSTSPSPTEQKPYKTPHNIKPNKTRNHVVVHDRDADSAAGQHGLFNHFILGPSEEIRVQLYCPSAFEEVRSVKRVTRRQAKEQIQRARVLGTGHVRLDTSLLPRGVGSYQHYGFSVIAFAAFPYFGFAAGQGRAEEARFRSKAEEGVRERGRFRE